MKLFGKGAWRSWLLAGLFLSLSAPVQADPLDNWQWRSPLPQGNHLNAAALGNGTIVAVGDAGAVVTFQDAINWTVRPTPTTNNLTGIAYGNGTFVAVGDRGTIITSPDGIHWTSQTSPVSGIDLKGIAYGNNVFVVVWEFSKGVIISPDGVNWVHHFLPGYSAEPYDSSVSITRVTYSTGAFYALGWEDCYGWCNFTGNEPPVVYSSSDGAAWTGPLDPSHYPANAGDGYGMVYGNGVYLKMADSLSTGTSVSVSLDGRIWTEVALPDSPYGYAKIYFFKGNFLVVGVYGYLATSPNGVDWTAATSKPLQRIRKVAFGNGVWAAIGDHVVYTSADGVSWTPRYTTGEDGCDFSGISYGNNRFVVAGLYDAVLTSPNGREWTQAPMGFQLDDVAFGKGTFVGASRDHKLLTSADGTNWTVRASYPPIQYIGTVFYRATFGKGIFAVIGSDTEAKKDVVSTSPDGVSWTTHALDTGEWYGAVNDICYGNDTFVIVGRSGHVYRSVNGDDWTAIVPEPGSGVSYGDLYGVAYGDASFVAIGGMNTGADILSSSNGIDWTGRRSPVTGGLRHIASVNHTFLASSPGGGVIQTARFDTPTPAPFTFADQTNAALSTAVASNAITVSGMNAAAPISVIDGAYAVNGGAYTDAPGMVNNGDVVAVRQTSAASYLTMTNTTLTIGGIFDTFSVTTGESPINLTVLKSGAGSGRVASTPPGIDCGADCNEQYDGIINVTLTAYPSAGSAFAGWSDGACPETGPCTLQVDGKRNVTATFIDRYGDIDGDGATTMADAILALRIATGTVGPEELNPGADVNHDGMIGMEEIVYILEKLARKR